jgi:type II secretory pathway predicted ATPase ExeA
MAEKEKTQMFCQRYQLKGDPFSKSLAAKDAFETSDFKECTARLDYLVRYRGIALVTAAPGYGKTFCVRAFAKHQNANVTKVIYLCMSTLSTMEFYRQLCVALGLESKYRKADMFKDLQDNLDYLYTIKKIHTVIVIDEAQYLSASVLRDLKMLANFDYDSHDRFSLVLCGQPVLADALSRQIHESLRQRIMVNYAFSGIRETEAAAYAKRMLTVAGTSQSLFDEAALHAAYNCSNGAIRVFGRILSVALSLGAQTDSDTITAEMVMAAANEVDIR